MFINYNNNFHTLKGNIMLKMIIDPKMCFQIPLIDSQQFNYM